MTGLHALDETGFSQTGVAPASVILSRQMALWLYSDVIRTLSSWTAGVAMLLPKSVVHGWLATVRPSFPGSRRTTTRFRSVSTATHGTPSTVRGAIPPVWPAGSLHSDAQRRFPVSLAKALRLPSLA